MRKIFFPLALIIVMAATGCNGPKSTADFATQSSAPPIEVPTTESQNLDTVLNNKESVHFVFWQNDQHLLPDNAGVVHLMPQPFEIRFAGAADKVFVVASHKPDIAAALDNAKLPVITLNGMGVATDADTLFIEDEAQVAPWEIFSKAFGAEEAAGFARTLHDKMGVLPMVLDARSQHLDSAGGAAQVLRVAKLSTGDLNREEITLLVVLAEPVDAELFTSLKWRRLRLVFDR